MKTLYKAIIIDDEPLARQRLRQLLSNYTDVVAVVGEADNGLEGYQLIDRLLPDLVFLDIEMPVLNGFDMLKKLEHQPRIVFVTAYDQYALKAFEENSIDYLLKPVEPERLEKTIRKITEVTTGIVQQLDLERLLSKLHTPRKQASSLTVRLGDRILLVKTSAIIVAEAEDKYVSLHTLDGTKHLTDYTLVVLEEMLPDDFVRIHRSTIINTNHIREIRKGFNGSFTFIMNTPSLPRFRSSRSYGEALKGRFGI